MALCGAELAAPSGRPPAPWLAILAGLGAGVATLFTFYVDGDDAFYVNKASWVAEHGTIPTRDTLYTDQRLGHLAGAGVPVQSIETLYGTFAHALGLASGTVVYLLAPPLLGAAAIWALWRLIRAWSTRRANLALVAAGAYVAVSLLGSWTMLRLWMGKAIFFALLLPLIYLYLTRWAARRRSLDAIMLGLAGVAAVGLTSSATVIVPVLAATAALVLALRTGIRVALGALLVAAYPVAAGLWVSAVSPPGDPSGPVRVGRTAFAVTFGSGVVAGVAWAALIAAAVIARRGHARTLAAGSALATLLVLATPVPRLIDAVTGSGVILYRLVWLAPVSALVGLLATVSLPVVDSQASTSGWARWSRAVPATVLVAGLFLASTAYWAAVPWRDPPAWKVDPVALRQARAITALRPGPGPVLAPRSTMMAIGISTTRIHAVSPNASYVYRRVIPESRADGDARITLHRIMFQHPLAPDLANAPAALRQLDVSMVCLYPSQAQARAVAYEAGYTTAAGSAGGLSCLTRAIGGLTKP